MKKTLFISAMLCMLLAPAWADSNYALPTNGDNLTVTGTDGRNLLLYNGAESGAITVAGSLDLGTIKVWIGSGNAQTQQAQASQTKVVNFSGVVSNANSVSADTEIGFAEWGNSGAHAIYVLTGDFTNLHGNMYVNHGGPTAAYSQVVLEVEDGFSSAARASLEDKTKTVLHLAGNATVKGLSGGGSTGGNVTAAATTTTLTLNVDANKDYTFSGTVGTNKYLTYGSDSYGTEQDSTAMNITKTGAGTQSFNGALNVNKLNVDGGTLGIGNGQSTTIGSLVMNNGTTLKVTGADTVLTINDICDFEVKSPNIVLGNGAKLIVNDKTWLRNATMRVKRAAAGSGGTMNLKGFLSGPDSGGTLGNLEVEQDCVLNITGTANTSQATGTAEGFIIWNKASHVYTINGTLNILGGIRAQRLGGTDAMTKTNATFNVGSNGVLQLNKGIDFVTDATTLTQLGTINVNGGTLAIGGQTTGNKATVNLKNNAKLVAIDTTTSTEQEFTVTDNATITLSGKGTSGEADNTLKLAGGLNNSTATAVIKGKVTLGGESNTLKAVESMGGDLLVLNNITVDSMTLNGATVTVKADHSGSLALQNLTVTGSGTTVNANLDLSDATVTLGGHSVELGCDLKFNGTTITLSAADIEQINTEAGLLLFTGVDSLTLGTSTYTEEDYHNYAGAAGLILSTTATRPETVYLNYSAADQTVTLSVVPEPATATLSLLALAALAARRRRK